MRLTPTILAATAALLTALPATALAIVPPHVVVGDETTMFTSPFAHAAGDVDRTEDLYIRSGDVTRLITDGATQHKQVFAGASKDGSVAFFQGDNDLLQARTPAGLVHVAPEYVSLEHVSDDGSRAYVQTLGRLTADDTDDLSDVYEYDTTARTLRLVSKSTGNWDAYFAAAAPDGSAYFTTREQVVDHDIDEETDVYRTLPHDAVSKVSLGDGAHPAYLQQLVDNGLVVLRTTESLLPTDTDSAADLYLTDGDDITTLLTPSPNAAKVAKAVYHVHARSTDAGRIIVTTAEALVPADGDAADDLYAFENGQPKLLTPGLGEVLVADVSDDAGTALIRTDAQLLASDTDQSEDMYLARETGLVHLAKTNQPFDHTFGHLSADGTVAAFMTAEAITAADADQQLDVYVHSAGSVMLASAPATGAAADPSLEAKTEGVLNTGEAVIYTTERLLPQDHHDGIDAYGFLNGKLSLISADTFAPETTLKPSGDVLSLASTEDGSFECRTDGGAWSACGETWTVGPLAPGEHLLEARALDASGNADATPAQHAVTIPGGGGGTGGPVEPPVTPPVADTAAPVISGAKAKRRRRVPTLTYTLSEAASVRVTVQRRAGRRWKTLRTVRLNAVAGANRSRLARLPRKGTFRFVLVAADAAGNASAKVRVR